MERLCRLCRNKCKDKGKKGTLLKYCSEAPEGHRILEPYRRFNDGKSKKTKSNKPNRAKGKGALSNDTDRVGERNQQTEPEQDVGSGGPLGKTDDS